MILGPLRHGLWFRRMVLEAISGVALRKMKLDKKIVISGRRRRDQYRHSVWNCVQYGKPIFK